jgi:hypothetical protein
MADDTAQISQSTIDSTALNDIATNGNLLNQNVSALIDAVGNLGNIVLPVARGGTGLDHVGTGDILYGSAPNVYSLLSDVATGNALISGGVGVAPSWGKITPSHFSGVLPVANGGTNRSTLTARAVLLGEGASSVNFAVPSTAGQPLLSNGPSSDPSFQAWVDGIAGFITFPNNQRYDLWLNSPFSFTITSTTTLCQSGSCTATWQVNASGVGTANSVSTTQQVQSQSISVPAGNTVNMTISSNSSCQGMSFMIKYTRP